MKTLFFVTLLLIGSTAQAAPFPTGNAETGKQFFEQNNCNSCHVQMLGGDGSKIFTRPNHKVHSEAQLIQQINFCGGNAGIRLTRQDVQNLGAYLNQLYYKLP